MVTFLLYLIGFLCFIFAAFGVAAARVNLVALGLACWILPALIAAFP